VHARSTWAFVVLMQDQMGQLVASLPSFTDAGAETFHHTICSYKHGG
jgi:hypothetical protein